MQPKKSLTIKQRTQRKSAQHATRTKTGVVIGVISALVLGVVITFVRLPALRIQSIDVEGNQLIASEEIMEALWQEMRGSTALGIPRSHTILLQQNTLETMLLETFPRIQRVTLEHASLQSLRVMVVEHAHAFMWCPTAVYTDCYFADETGLLFAKAPYFSGNVFLTFVGGAVNPESPINSRILDNQDELAKVTALIKVFTDARFKVSGVTIGNNYEYTLHVQGIDMVRTPDTDILVTTQLPGDMLLRNVRLAMDTESFQKSFVASPATLDYIDARLAEKVFYKFGTAIPVPPTTDAAPVTD